MKMQSGNALFKKWYFSNAGSIRGKFRMLPKIRSMAFRIHDAFNIQGERFDMREAKSLAMLQRYALKLTSSREVQPKARLKTCSTRAVGGLVSGDMHWRQDNRSTDEYISRECPEMSPGQCMA